MMKRIRDFFLFFSVLCVLTLALAARAEAGDVYDNAGVLSQSEKQRLTEQLKAVEQKHNVKIGIVVQKSAQGRHPGQVANALLDQGYKGAPNGGILLYMAMDKRDWYVSTDNPMRARITDDAGIKHLSGEFLSSFKKNRFAEGFGKFISTVDEMLTYYEKEGKPYDPSAGFHPIAALIAAVIAFLGGTGVKSAMISSMSNVRPAVKASDYLVEGSLDLTEESDQFLFTNVTRTPKAKSSTSARDSSHGGGGGKF